MMLKNDVKKEIPQQQKVDEKAHIICTQIL